MGGLPLSEIVINCPKKRKYIRQSTKDVASYFVNGPIFFIKLKFGTMEYNAVCGTMAVQNKLLDSYSFLTMPLMNQHIHEILLGNHKNAIQTLSTLT